MEHKHKNVIITGSARGIGKEIALTLAEEGYEIIIADIDEKEGKACTEQIKASGGKADFIYADISRPSDIKNLVAFTVKTIGGIDLLINNAGIGIWKSPDILTLDEWDSVINTNLRGAFLCSREAAADMKSRGGGSIINIASTRALMSEPHSEAYAASKGGIVALTHALAASYAKDNIRVNCISPGWIETGDYNDLSEKDHAQHFSGRVGKPSDIAQACIFLADNDFINATNIVIDGGMTKKMIYEP